MYFFEGVFFLDIVVNFMLSYEYTSEYGKGLERNIGNIASHYFYGNFIKDLIPIVPFQLIPLPKNRATLFYLIKMFRLIKGFKLLDERYVMNKIKTIYKRA